MDVSFLFTSNVTGILRGPELCSCSMNMLNFLSPYISFIMSIADSRLSRLLGVSIPYCSLASPTEARRSPLCCTSSSGSLTSSTCSKTSISMACSGGKSLSSAIVAIGCFLRELGLSKTSLMIFSSSSLWALCADWYYRNLSSNSVPSPILRVSALVYSASIESSTSFLFFQM